LISFATNCTNFTDGEGMKFVSIREIRGEFQRLIRQLRKSQVYLDMCAIQRPLDTPGQGYDQCDCGVKEKAGQFLGQG